MTVKIPDGYRELNNGEDYLLTDQYWNGFEWKNAVDNSNIGRPYSKGVWQTCIRKIEFPQYWTYPSVETRYALKFENENEQGTFYYFSGGPVTQNGGFYLKEIKKDGSVGNLDWRHLSNAEIEKLEKAQEKNSMKENFDVYVPNKFVSEMVQKMAFANGWKWVGEGPTTVVTQEGFVYLQFHVDSKYISHNNKQYFTTKFEWSKVTEEMFKTEEELKVGGKPIKIEKNELIFDGEKVSLAEIKKIKELYNLKVGTKPVLIYADGSINVGCTTFPKEIVAKVFEKIA